LKPEDQAESKLVELGMEIMNVELDDSVYQDRELITGSSNLGAQKFSEFAIPILLAKYQMNSSHPGDGSKKKGHFLDAAFLEYQFAEDIVDEAVDARHMLQEVLYQLKKDVDFEKENLEVKEKVVVMWGKRIEQFEKLHARTSAGVEKNSAALEAKRRERTSMRSDLMAMRNGATAATVKQDMKKAEKQVVQLQKLQDVIDEMQTSFRADRAERHTVKMNLKRCRGYKKAAVDEVAQQRNLISDMTRECTENNAPAKLALLAATDVERKAIRNAGTIRGRMWRTWRKWRRADTKTKKEAVSAKRQARRASQKRLKAARQDKKQAVKEIQKQTQQIVREGVKDAQKIR